MPSPRRAVLSVLVGLLLLEFPGKQRFPPAANRLNQTQKPKARTRVTLLDENAFGLLVAFFDIEDVEYASERDEFVTRFTEFRSVALDHAAGMPLGQAALAIDLGHAVYFEIGDGEQAVDPIGWLRELRGTLSARGFVVTAVVSHGGRWVDDTELESPETGLILGGYRLLRVARPSEPLRRALYVEAATHGSEGDDGWGSGLYVDTEAVEALGKTLKNAPTPLSVAGATFFRIGR